MFIINNLGYAINPDGSARPHKLLELYNGQLRITFNPETGVLHSLELYDSQLPYGTLTGDAYFMLEALCHEVLDNQALILLRPTRLDKASTPSGLRLTCKQTHAYAASSPSQWPSAETAIQKAFQMLVDLVR